MRSLIINPVTFWVWYRDVIKHTLVVGMETALSISHLEYNIIYMTIELTKEEVHQLLQLIDIATKAGGLNVAQSALYFAAKLSASLKEKPEEAKE